MRNIRLYLVEGKFTPQSLHFLNSLKNHRLLVELQAYFDDLGESGMYVVVDNESNYPGGSYRSNSKKSAREYGAYIQD